MNQDLIAPGVVAGIATIFGIYKYIHRPVKDVVIPAPTVLRTDLMYGYYGRLGDQVAETIDHVNILWESQFEGEFHMIQNILAAKLPTVLDVATQCFQKIEETGRNYHYRADAEELLRATFMRLQANDALRYVKYLSPLDEPNTNTNIVDLLASIRTCKKVALEFPELTDVKFAVIYAAKPETYDCIALFDLVGLDDYDNKSKIFTNGTYARLKAQLRSNQKTIIMPGGGFGQDITPFINFAHSNPEVFAVIAFVWFGHMSPNDTWIGIGDDKNPLKSQYVQAGKLLTGK